MSSLGKANLKYVLIASIYFNEGNKSKIKFYPQTQNPLGYNLISQEVVS
jgi:hypothetical protein